MTALNKQALREAALNAKTAGEAPVMSFDQRIDALNAFTKLLTPVTAIALLDENEALVRANSAQDDHINQQQDHIDSLEKKNGQIGKALGAAEKRIAELERERENLRPVGVMSQKAFHRLEGSESRFIALWPRPGIYLQRKRPEDGVIVYARTDSASKGE
ncbi:hypothetical protein [Edwardsiella piscicida]|uniref:hypothetical protein n=1 Tax=Edwardsiella piscicida TaxID=1263550 RepID=UPI0020C8A998|nr:hypothetical protein [Edwardsiella piscicida]WAM43666.1 hypothetical protein NMC32_12075 [Edwardsiella piscicida]